MDRMIKARDGVEAQHGLNDVSPGDAYPATMTDSELLALAKRRLCLACEGRGWVPNPNAFYSMDYVEHLPTGIYSTIDPEEIDCPTCGGVGFKRPADPSPPPPSRDDREEPF